MYYKRFGSEQAPAVVTKRSGLYSVTKYQLLKNECDSSGQLVCYLPTYGKKKSRYN
jgi:hypothetical protein